MINILGNKEYTTGLTKAAAWKRCTARLVDMCFYPTFVFLILGAICGLIDYEKTMVALDAINIWEQSNSQAVLIEKLCVGLFTCIILIPISYMIFGTTSAQKLMDIAVVTNKSDKLGYVEAVEREVQVFFKGLVFSIFSFIYQYFAFKKNNNFSWDKSLKLEVHNCGL